MYEREYMRHAHQYLISAFRKNLLVVNMHRIQFFFFRSCVLAAVLLIISAVSFFAIRGFGKG